MIRGEGNLKKIYILLLVLLYTGIGILVFGYPVKNFFCKLKNEEHYAIPPHFVVYNCGYLLGYASKETNDDLRTVHILYEGEITSSVESYEIARENNQSNFGTGYGYRYTDDGSMELYYDGEWIICTLSQFKFGKKWYDLDDLSEETIEWIMYYNMLTPSEKEKITSFPKPVSSRRIK